MELIIEQQEINYAINFVIFLFLFEKTKKKNLKPQVLNTIN